MAFILHEQVPNIEVVKNLGIDSLCNESEGNS